MSVKRKRSAITLSSARVRSHSSNCRSMIRSSMSSFTSDSIFCGVGFSRLREALSLADTVESASRSLEKPTPQKIESLVNELIEERISDRQFDDCDLTLRDLKDRKRVGQGE